MSDLTWGIPSGLGTGLIWSAISTLVRSLSGTVPPIGITAVRSTVGGAILLQLIEEARRRGMPEVVLAAQTHALGFHRKHGFAAQGGVYMEAGIPHQEMRLDLHS